MLVRSAYTALWLLDQHIGSRKRIPFHRIRKTLHTRLTRPNGARTRLDRIPELRIDYLDAASLRGLESSGPVLFKGLAAKIPARSSWTLRSLVQLCGELKHPANHSGDDYYNVEVLRLKEVLEAIEAGKATYALYGRGPADLLNVHPQLREDLSVASWMDDQHRRGWRLPGSYLYVTPAGHWTPIHNEVGQFLTVQVQGSRRWTIYPPARSPELFPEVRGGAVLHSHLYANATRLREESFGLRGWECVLEEGDVLFCPNYYWHFVETLRTSASTSLRWATLRSLARHPVMTALFAKRIFSQSPDVQQRLLDVPYEG